MIVSLGACLLTALIACATLEPREARAATLSWRFIGLEGLKGKTNLAVFRQVSGLKEFEGFKSNLADRVAQSLAQHAMGGGTNAELVNLLRPIAADMISYESLFERGAESSNICALAVKLPAARHEIWKKNWEPILKAVKIEGASLSREGDWTLVTNGKSKQILDRAKSAASDVLEFDGDAGSLIYFFPGLGSGKASLKVQAQGKALRTEGKIRFEKDLALKLDKWEIPVNTIREPLAGFTAVQGVGESFAKLPGFSKHPAPNQIFVWSEMVAPFSTYAAAKVDDPAKFVRDVAEELPKSEAAKGLQGRLEMNTNSHSLVLLGLPIAVPFLRPAHSNDVNFVCAGLMPLDQIGPTPMPPELAREVSSRKDLVYYDWEIVALRSQLWPATLQTLSFAKGQTPGNFSSPTGKWLLEAEKKIGEAVTEVTQTGPRELTIVRKSDLGLSSFELCKLVEWTGESATEEKIAPRSGGPAMPAPKKR